MAHLPVHQAAVSGRTLARLSRLHMLHRYRLHGLSTLALCTVAYGGFPCARDKTHVCLRFKKPSPRIPCYRTPFTHVLVSTR